MKVQRIDLGNYKYRYLLLDDNFQVVEPVKNYLKYLDNTDKSENTIKNYAHHLKIYFEYLSEIRIAYNEIHKKGSGVEVLSDFIGWLKNPNYINKNIIILQPLENKRDNKTINLIMNTILSFYDYLARSGEVEKLDVYKSVSSQRTFKGFLYELMHNKENIRTNIFKLKEKDKKVETITEEQYKLLLENCNSLRDKLLIAIMYEGGLRIGETLGLFLEDFNVRENNIDLKYRKNLENGVSLKNFSEGTIIMPKYVMKLFTDYIIEEFGDFDSNYVFINFKGKNIGKPMKYITAKKLFERLSKKIEITITPHMLRHTHATQLIEQGDFEPIDVKERLRHKHVQTTVDTYIHLSDKYMQEKYKSFLKNHKGDDEDNNDK